MWDAETEISLGEGLGDFEEIIKKKKSVKMWKIFFS